MIKSPCQGISFVWFVVVTFAWKLMFIGETVGAVHGKQRVAMLIGNVVAYHQNSFRITGANNSQDPSIEFQSPRLRNR
jgi:hypothetical protein